MKELLRPALVLIVVLSVMTGIVYPLVVMGVGSTVFAKQADGSLIVRDGKIVGSELIGQAFSNPRYFWGRPSATAPMPYNAAASVGSNLAPTNPALVDAAKARIDALKSVDPQGATLIPVDLVSASASGLDPHVSPAAAQYQVARVAKSRGLDANKVRQLVEAHTEPRQWGILGEPRVNVLALNLALSELRRK